MGFGRSRQLRKDFYATVARGLSAPSKSSKRWRNYHQMWRKFVKNVSLEKNTLGPIVFYNLQFFIILDQISAGTGSAVQEIYRYWPGIAV